MLDLAMHHGSRSFLRRVVTLLHVLAALALSFSASAEKLKVYTKPIEPFAFQQDGKAAGFSIELWERLAKEANLEYEIVWADSVSALIDALKKREADAAIAAISITAERQAVVDFSQPFYESGLSILVNAQTQSSLALVAKSLFNADFVKLVGVVFAMLFVTAHLVWLFERKYNPEQFPAPYLRGVWESAWWAISTILSGGCDAKGPVVIGGRIVGAFWMLVCIVFITYFTASITTIMTVNQLSSDINGPSDLPGRPVATVKGTTAERYLTGKKAEVHAFATIDEAYDALAKKSVQAVVYDAPILLYHVKNASGLKQQVVGRLFQRQNYGIGLQHDSPHRGALNDALLRLREAGFLDDLQTKWFGNQE
jgi:polar amino acid transport system substrate-binding protein